MAELKKVNGGQVIDYMARDYDSILNTMRELIPIKFPEWQTYRSEADFGNVLLQLFAHMADILSYYQDRVANESFLSTARTRRNIIQHLRLIGYRLSTAAPAAATLKVTLPKDVAPENIWLKTGDAFAADSRIDGPSVRFEYTGDSKNFLTANDLHDDPEDNTKKYFTIPVEEGRLIAKETLGVSTGKPNQRFLLTHKRLILRGAENDFKLTVDHDPDWTLRESLAFSREGQKDFIIEVDENDAATIIFGDGDFGCIPPLGATITATYRVGGGVHGNVPSGAIKNIIAPQLVGLNAAVTNSKPATGGADRETIEHAVMQAPSVFRSLKRAVTTRDFEALAMDFPGVGKARAIAGNWNTVELFIAPAGGGLVSDVMRADLLYYFEDKRPVTTIVEINDVAYVKIYLSLYVGAERSYVRQDIRNKVIQTVADLMDFDRVDFGQPLYLSKFYEAIEDIDGVGWVNIEEFRQQGDPQGSISPDGRILTDLDKIPILPDGSGDNAEEDQPYLQNGGILIEVEGGIDREASQA